MRFFKYWAKESGLLRVAGQEKEASSWGGSDLSVEEARTRAREQLSEVQRKIDGGESGRGVDYEAGIREEVLETLDPRSLVSRNRYGARILNSEDTVFVDIDEAPLSLRAWLKSLFSKPKSKKEAIVELVRERARSLVYHGLGIRVYETAEGVRLIVSGRTFDPRSQETRKLFNDFNADGLYARLCRKQGCFRARLSPKPARMKLKSHKVEYPRDPGQQAELEAWLEGYEAASRGYAVCRYVETLGQASLTPAVRYHDAAVRAFENLKLA